MHSFLVFLRTLRDILEGQFSWFMHSLVGWLQQPHDQDSCFAHMESV